MGEWVGRVVWAFGSMLLIATLLPVIPTNEWWVRIFDFPRAQIAALIALVLVAVAILGMLRRRTGLLLGVALVAELTYQLIRILPYTAVSGRGGPKRGDVRSRRSTAPPRDQRPAEQPQLEQPSWRWCASNVPMFCC